MSSACVKAFCCVVIDLEDELNRQARELETLSADVSAMETQLEQMLRTLSELNPDTIACTAQFHRTDTDTDIRDAPVV